MRSELKRALKQFGLGIMNLVIAIALLIAVQVVPHGHVPNLVLGIIGAAIMAAVYLVGGRLIERYQPAEFAGVGGIREFACGLGLGFCLFSVVMLLLWPLSVYRPVGWGTAAGLGAGAVAALAGAVVEEVMFRGFLFRLVAGLAGTWWALLVTSALFGAAHAFNPGATVLSSIAICSRSGCTTRSSLCPYWTPLASNWPARGVEFHGKQRIWDERFRFRRYKRINRRDLERANDPDGRKFWSGGVDRCRAGVPLGGIANSMARCSARPCPSP